jgi:hypothetical protein
VCSVRGLYRAFPPPDPPVYVRPQLKPPCGICSFTTTTFGAHRGADQGAGRSTSRRDLLHLLGGLTSALPPSTAGILHLPGLTSTRPGRHTAVPDLHRHLQAGTRFPRASIFMSRPAYLCLGRHMWARGRLRHSPGRHMCSVQNIRHRAGLFQFWPIPAGSCRFWATQQHPGRPGPVQRNPGTGRGIFPRVGRLLRHPGCPISVSPR